jgi:DNA-binding CsgD family transcriptional regulator
LFTAEDLKVIQEMMLKSPVCANRISLTDYTSLNEQIWHFTNFFRIKSNFRLFFIMFSTQLNYVNCKRLSQRENEVLNLFCLGNTRSEIRKKLNIKDGTISSIKTNILFKYGVNNSREALIEVLKETNTFKTPLDSMLDVKFFEIDL